MPAIRCQHEVEVGEVVRCESACPVLAPPPVDVPVAAQHRERARVHRVAALLGGRPSGRHLDTVETGVLERLTQQPLAQGRAADVAGAHHTDPVCRPLTFTRSTHGRDPITAHASVAWVAIRQRGSRMALSLEPLGLGRREDVIYARLVEIDSADARTLAADLGLSADDVGESLRLLTDRGLTHQEGLQGHRYRALSPHEAFPELIRQRRMDLNRLQAEADQLREDVGSALAGAGAAVVPVIGAAAVHDVCARIQRAAQREVLMVDAPPYFDCGVQPNPTEFSALATGVSYRVVYHSEAVRTEVEREAMRSYIAAGEQARANAQAWPKMLVVDGAVAVIPESSTDPDPERRPLITSSCVVDLLVARFEDLWERSTPVEAIGRAHLSSEGDISDRDRELLTLMAAGLKDRAIARSLGVTERTVSRRIQELMRRLDADTRFRAGIRAVQEGWIAS